jgi:hypothetical protein
MSSAPTAGLLAGAIVTLLVSVAQWVSSHFFAYTLDIPKEVDAAFVTIFTFGISKLLD